MRALAQAAGLTLPLEQAQDVALTHGSLHVADDRTRRVVDELDADLGHVTGVAGTAQDPVYFCELYGLLPVRMDDWRWDESQR